MTKTRKKASQSSTRSVPSADCPEGSRLQDCAQEATDTGSIDKIRDIIFGNQMKDYERRFDRLEDRLQKQIREMRAESTKRLDAMETFFKQEVEALNGRLKTQQTARDDSAKKLAKEIKDASRFLSKNIEQLEEKQSKDARELRQQLLDLSKDLASEIRKKHKESSKALDRAFKELNEDKVARTTLSELLMELAVRTSNELAEKFNLETGKLKDE